MTPQEQERIRKTLNGLENRITIRIHLTDDDRGLAFQAFFGKLQSLNPGIRIEKKTHEAGLPFFKVADNVSYQAIPLGKELDPFLDFLSVSGDDAGHLVLPDQKILDQVILDQIRAPAKLTVFISSQCPFCPQTVASVLMLARQCRLIHVTVVDGAMFPEIVKEAQVRSVPTVVLDSRFRWTGAIDLHEIVNIIISRDPAQLSADSLQQMIEDGKAEALSSMMADSDKVYPAFLDLLTHSKWAVRLGAMAAFEYLNENSESLALHILDALWDRFGTVSEGVKGDILYLFGESRRPEMIDRLASVCDGLYSDDVREAAREALGVLADSRIENGTGINVRTN